MQFTRVISRVSTSPIIHFDPKNTIESVRIPITRVAIEFISFSLSLSLFFSLFLRSIISSTQDRYLINELAHSIKFNLIDNTVYILLIKLSNQTF